MAGAAEMEIHRALESMLRPSSPPPGRAGRLTLLFEVLADPLSADPPHEIEDAIWAVWTAHDDAEAEGLMERAIAATAGRRDAEAMGLLELLIERWPDWAEAWNKRATLHYIMGRDAESAADVAETLAREPRHFGAMAGLGQICLRQGDTLSAMAAFDAALAVHPSLEQVRALRARLGENAPKPN